MQDHSYFIGLWIARWLFVAFLNFIKPIPTEGSYWLLITLLTLASFAIIAGLSPSVLRSVVMFSFVAVGYQLRRTVNIY
jgi:competence protein ComEC